MPCPCSQTHSKVEGTGPCTSIKEKKKEIISNDEDEAWPQKRKKASGGNLDHDADSVNLDEGRKKLRARVFSQASEDAQDTNGNTEASSDLDDSGKVSTGEADGTDEEWQFSQMQEMAVKDAKDVRVSNNCYMRLLQLTSGTCIRV